MRNNNGIIASSPSTYAVKWKVTNSLTFPIQVQWIDFEGKIDRKHAFVVQPGETASPGHAFIGYLFLITNETASAPAEKFVSAISVIGEHTIIA